MRVNPLLAAALALVVSASSQPILIRLLPRLGLVDLPNARSSHSSATPRGGGIGVVAALCVGTLLIPSVPGRVSLVVLTPFLSAVGLADDVLGGVRPLVRLTCQFVAGGVAGYVLLPSLPGGVGAAVGAMWVASYTNAFNFMDGINGMSAVQAVVAGLSFVAAGLVYGEVGLLGLGLVIACASAGFLPFNAAPARIFLGDVGSYGLGATIAGTALVAVDLGLPIIIAIAPTLLYALDTCYTLAMRTIRGDSPAEAHRDHVYQRLVRGGLGHMQVTMIAGLASCVVVVAAFVVQSSLAIGIVAMIAPLAAYLTLPSVLGHSRK